jgi:hypothetical protein
MGNVEEFDSPRDAGTNLLILSEESARDSNPGYLAHDVEAFVVTLLNSGRYTPEDFPPATRASAGLALYIGGVRNGGHAGFLQQHGTGLFNCIKPGIALAGLANSLGPIWSGYEAYIAKEGRTEPYAEDEKPVRLSGRRVEKLLKGLFPSDPAEIYFPLDAWRSPLLEDLDRRFNAVSDDAYAQLKRFVLALPNARLLPGTEWAAEIRRLSGA